MQRALALAAALAALAVAAPGALGIACSPFVYPCHCGLCPHIVDCAAKATAECWCGTAAPGVHAHPTDSGKFWMCSFDAQSKVAYGVEVACPARLVFDPVVKACTVPSAVTAPAPPAAAGTKPAVPAAAKPSATGAVPAGAAPAGAAPAGAAPAGAAPAGAAPAGAAPAGAPKPAALAATRPATPAGKPLLGMKVEARGAVSAPGAARQQERAGGTAYVAASASLAVGGGGAARKQQQP